VRPGEDKNFNDSAGNNTFQAPANPNIQPSNTDATQPVISPSPSVTYPQYNNNLQPQVNDLSGTGNSPRVIVSGPDLLQNSSSGEEIQKSRRSKLVYAIFATVVLIILGSSVFI